MDEKYIQQLYADLAKRYGANNIMSYDMFAKRISTDADFQKQTYADFSKQYGANNILSFDDFSGKVKKKVGGENGAIVSQNTSIQNQNGTTQNIEPTLKLSDIKTNGVQKTTTFNPNLATKPVSTEEKVNAQYTHNLVQAGKEKKEKDITDAATNTAYLWAKNNPVLGVMLNKTSDEGYNATKLKQLKSNPQFVQKVGEIRNGISNGKYDIHTGNDGQMYANIPMSPIKNFLSTFGTAWSAGNEAKKVNKMNDDEFIKYANEIKPETYLPIKENPENISGDLGGTLPILTKGAIAYGATALLNYFAPVVGEFISPALASWLATVPEMTQVSEANQKLYWYKRAKEENPNISDKEALDKAKTMSTIAGAETAITGTALNFMGVGGRLLPKGTGQGFINATKQWLAKTSVNATATGLLASSGSLAKDLIAKHGFGYNITQGEITSNFDDAMNQMFLTQGAFDVLHGLTPSPKYVKSQAKEVASKLEPQVLYQMQKEAVDNGTLTQEQVNEANKDLNGYKQTEKQVIPTGDEEKDAVIKGLIQKKNNLQEQKKQLDETQHPQIDEQIKAINAKVSQAMQSENPLSFEQDDLTGEHNANPKEFDELKKKEQNGVVVPKDYGEATVKEVGEGENKKYIPQASFINKQGVIEISEPIKIEDAKEYTDKDKAQQAADNALARHYYDNGLHPIKKPQKERQAEVIQQPTDEPVNSGNELISSKEGQPNEATVNKVEQGTQVGSDENKIDISKADIEKRRQEELLKSEDYADKDITGKMTIAQAEKEINAKYDAELANLKPTTEPTKVGEGTQEIRFIKSEDNSVDEGMAVKPKEGYVYRVVDNATDAVGNDKSFSNKTDWYDGEGFLIEAKNANWKNIEHHEGSKRGDIKDSDVTTIYYEPDGISTDRKTVQLELEKMKKKFPNAKFIEVESIEDKNGNNQLHIKKSGKEPTQTKNTEEEKQIISKPINQTENAIQEQSTGSILQHTQSTVGETGGERRGMESGIEGNETTRTQEKSKSAGEKENVSVKRPPTQLSHQGEDKLVSEFGGENYFEKPETKKRVALFKEADELEGKGITAPKLMYDLESGAKHGLSDAEHVIMVRYADALATKLRATDPNSPEWDRLIKERNKVINTSSGSGTESARALGARNISIGGQDPESYENFINTDYEANNNAPLTENQKAEAITEFSKLKKDKEQFEKDRTAFEDEVAKFKAEQEAAKLQKSTKKSSIIFAQQVRELIAIAPHVKNVLADLLEEGALKLGDAIEKLYEDFKEFGVTKRNIHDIIAGEYDNKKIITKTEAKIAMENLRSQATLINKLEKLESGEVPKNEKAKRKRLQEINDLQKQIKEHGITQLSQLKKRNETETKEIKEIIDKGDFAPEEKRVPILQNKEYQKRFPQLFKDAQQSKDELNKTRHEIALRRLKWLYEHKSDKEKTFEVISKSLNIPRTLMTIGDFSAVFRQAAVATAAHPIIASKALKFMFEAAANEKIYSRWLDEVHNDPLWEEAEKSKLPITDPESLRAKEHEEAFYGAQYAEQIPLAGAVVKASERAYNGYLNFIRWEMFKMYANEFREQGKTYDNNPELYKGISSFIGSATGRGGMRFGESASPVLNALLFASRLIASRVNMLGLTDIPNLVVRGVTLGKHGVDYGFYSKLPKEIRVKAAADMLKFVGVGISTLVLAKQMGANVELDPRSSDFGKIHDGDTRWDIWGGFQPYARLLAQIVSGQAKSANTGKVYDLDGSKFGSRTVGDQIVTFGRGKLSPIFGTAADILTKRTLDQQTVDKNFDIPFYSGDNPPQGQITLTDEMLKFITPLIAHDVMDAWKSRGVNSLYTVLIPSLFGIGVQTYSPKTPSSSRTESHSSRQPVSHKRK